MADVTIVVGTGPFDSVEAAAYGEARVVWHDADPRDDTACTECFAAVELQRYLRKITGGGEDFGIADDAATPSGDLILVGGPASNTVSAQFAGRLGVSREALEDLGPEGYRIRSGPADGRRVLLIAGGGRVGTLYGVYDLLYRLGCRWFAPGEIHEEMPHIDFEAVGDWDVVERPKFSTRGFHAWEDRGNDAFFLWMARNRLNYWCADEDNHPFLRKLGLKLVWGGHIVGFRYLQPDAPYPYTHAQCASTSDLPEDPYPVSEDFLGDENGDGVLSYREAHPEWYGLIDGQRSKALRDGGVNYCTSNPHATDELMKNLLREFIDGEAKDADIVNFWTVDGGKWCTCDACKALGSPTDRNLLLVHRFDQEVKKAQSAGLIQRPTTTLFLAYADVLEPPTRPLPDGFDYETCIATYFPIVRCYVHTFDGPTCPKNSRYADHLGGWAVDPERHYRGQICIGEYYNVSGYKCLPICYMQTMANDIPFYYSAMNARHFHYMHVTTGNWGNKALTNYQMARQLWDPAADCAGLWDDYFAKRYGAAAKEMRLFYTSLERMFCNVSEIKYGLCRRLSEGSADLFPDPHMRHYQRDDLYSTGPNWVEVVHAGKRCREILDQVAAMRLPDLVAARVAEDERMFTYGERTVAFYDALVRAYLELRDNRLQRAREAFAEAANLAELLRADVTSTTMSSSHANAPDALNASRAASAMARLTEILGPPIPEEMKAFDLTKGAIVLTGRDFSGGGAVVYGYQLHVFPGRVKVSDHGNYVYARAASPHDHMTAWFRVKHAREATYRLKVTGLRCPQPPGGDVPAQIRINEHVILEGNIPFAEDGLSSHEFELPAEALKEGTNTIQVRNAAEEGRLGSRPWFGVHQVEIEARPQ